MLKLKNRVNPEHIYKIPSIAPSNLNISYTKTATQGQRKLWSWVFWPTLLRHLFLPCFLVLSSIFILRSLPIYALKEGYSLPWYGTTLLWLNLIFSFLLLVFSIFSIKNGLLIRYAFHLSKDKKLFENYKQEVRTLTAIEKEAWQVQMYHKLRDISFYANSSLLKHVRIKNTNQLISYIWKETDIDIDSYLLDEKSEELVNLIIKLSKINSDFLTEKSFKYVLSQSFGSLEGTYDGSQFLYLGFRFYESLDLNQRKLMLKEVERFIAQGNAYENYQIKVMNRIVDGGVS